MIDSFKFYLGKEEKKSSMSVDQEVDKPNDRSTHRYQGLNVFRDSSVIPRVFERISRKKVMTQYPRIFFISVLTMRFKV